MLRVISQESENTCGLAALRNALALLGKQTTEGQLKGHSARLGVALQQFGVFSAQIGILAQEYGFASTLITRNVVLREALRKCRYNRQLFARAEVRSNDWRTGKFLHIAQLFVRRGGCIQLRSGGSVLRRILGLNARSVVVVRVGSRNYYGIPRENWAHYVTVDILGSGRLSVLDPYAERGQRFYGSRWSYYLRRSQLFDWSGWDGDLLLLRSPS